MPKKSDAFKQLKSLHLALLAGAFAFTFTVFFGQRSITNHKVDETTEKMMLIAVLFIAASCMLGGLTLFKKRVAELQNSPKPTQNRMNQYRAACVMFWAMLEGASILSAIGILITGNYVFVGVSGLLIIILALFAPRKESIIATLNLETDEVAQLEGNSEMKG